MKQSNSITKLIMKTNTNKPISVADLTFRAVTTPTSEARLFRIIAAGAVLIFLGLCLKARSAELDPIRARAHNGEPQAQYELARGYEQGIQIEQNDRLAVKWYRQAAAQNLPQAQYRLGRMYARGAGVTRDFRSAAEWFEKAETQGYGPARNSLGRLHQQGLGMPADRVAAYRYFASSGAIYGEANQTALAPQLSDEELAAARAGFTDFLAGNPRNVGK